MLQKNVYIIYPAGYHGNYVKWAIEVSDTDRRESTVLDPLNRSTSSQFGGAGTSHGHVRIPTHQAFNHHHAWVILNRPTSPMVYIINSNDESAQNLCNNIVQLLMQDPTGIIITITDNNDSVAQSYGRINCVIKWPTFMPATDAISTVKKFEIHENFDPFDCANDRLFRNRMVTDNNALTSNNYSNRMASGPLDLDLLDSAVAKYNDWYAVRNRFQPHEVNEKTYVAKINYQNRIYQFNIKDIPSDKFLSELQHLLDMTDISDNFNLDVVEQHHNDYVLAQSNLQWFDSFDHWDQTGTLDTYLQSHSIIQAELLRAIMLRCNVQFNNTNPHTAYETFYNIVRGPDWPDTSTIADFYKLPVWVKKEILVDFEYKMPNPVMCELNWQNMSLQEINHVYQTQIKSKNLIDQGP
jgi:hypothetical protein